MKLDISALEKAVERLQEGLLRYQQDISDTQIRDGLVQRFEFTYELSHKLLKRYLESVSASPATLDSLPFADLIRTASEQGLLSGDWPAWRGYREMRGKTSHAYDEQVAIAVVTGIPDFLAEALFLRDQLRLRLA